MKSDLELIFCEGYTTVFVNVLYFLPDHHSLVNEFVWSTLDISPKYPRVKRFIDYWHKEIDAKIKEVVITDTTSLKYNIRAPYVFELPPRTFV